MRLSVQCLILLVALVSLGCPAKPAGKAPVGPVASDGVTVAKERQLAGAYECKLEIGDNTMTGTCTVTSQGKGFQLVMSGSDRFLVGTLEGTEPGFRFVGTLKCQGQDCTEEVVTDFFEQSPGNYSGVFALESGPLVNATMTIRQ